MHRLTMNDYENKDILDMGFHLTDLQSYTCQNYVWTYNLRLSKHLRYEDRIKILMGEGVSEWSWPIIDKQSQTVKSWSFNFFSQPWKKKSIRITDKSKENT